MIAMRRDFNITATADSFAVLDDRGVKCGVKSKIVYQGRDLGMAVEVYERLTGLKLSPDQRQGLWHRADMLGREER